MEVELLLRVLPGSRTVKAAGWFCVVLITYLSLIPEVFQVQTGVNGAVSHVFAYACTAGLLFLAYPSRFWSIVALLSIYSGSMEALQGAIPGRQPELVEAVASSAGAWLGILLTRHLLAVLHRKALMTSQAVLVADGPARRDVKFPASFFDPRRALRQTVFLSARVYFRGQPNSTICTVTDISDGGARLCFGMEVDVPAELDLYIPRLGRRVRARVVWSSRTTCGVAFLDEPRTAQPVRGDADVKTWSVA